MIIQGNPDGRADDEANGGHFRRKNMHYDPATTTCGAESGVVDLNQNFPHPEWQRGGESVRVQPELSRCVGWIGTRNAEYCGVHTIGAASRYEWERPQQNVRIEHKNRGDDGPAQLRTGLLLAVGVAGAPNEEGLRAMGHKLVSHTTPRYSTDNPSCCAGDTADWGYYYLGMATFTMEMGTDFYQECGTFEETVVPNVIRSLVYAARVAKAPYLYTKGPDVMGIDVRERKVK